MQWSEQSETERNETAEPKHVINRSSFGFASRCASISSSLLARFARTKFRNQQAEAPSRSDSIQSINLFTFPLLRSLRSLRIFRVLAHFVPDCWTARFARQVLAPKFPGAKRPSISPQRFIILELCMLVSWTFRGIVHFIHLLGSSSRNFGISCHRFPVECNETIQGNG